MAICKKCGVYLPTCGGGVYSNISSCLWFTYQPVTVGGVTGVYIPTCLNSSYTNNNTPPCREGVGLHQNVM